MLFGHWVSTFTHTVEFALKVKDIPYEYVEEDLTNKSCLLLHYNAVHIKVPVLLHKGKPTAESVVILEYIDDCWNTAPKLLPEDLSQRAQVRFRAAFYDQKVVLLSASFHSVFWFNIDLNEVVLFISYYRAPFRSYLLKAKSERMPWRTSMSYLECLKKE